MDADRWRQVERVLDRALDGDPAEWPAIVAEECAGDDALRREVEQLLAEHGRDDGILAAGAGAVAADVVREHEAELHADPLVGARLGPWRVVREIGRGGMSRVFLGERSDGAFAQRVAVKVLRAGLDTAADIARFRIERQILASLDHPNIARLLDGGMAPDGRPYLVLEFIEGEPLTRWCDARGLDLGERLRLFLSVAEATQSAHRRLVVHRDLKPSNILVGADGRPRLLDFGIAKIVDPTDAAAWEATATRRRWLTPDYAAPEQFTGAPVTTATDVYQLGAVLYQLLSGRRPFDATQPGQTGRDGRAARDTRFTPDTLEARVLRDDPPPPSTHAPALRGDLDAVILKALRKEPEARYPSVAELAADVQRYLDGEPVAARAGNRAYRWRRTARRHALSLSLAAAAVVTVAVYAGTLVAQNRKIARALAAANVQREKAEQVTAFTLGLFQASDPRQGRGDTITARALLERGEARANALERQPEVQAEMLDVIGRVRSDLGAFPEARPSLERALAIRRRLLGDSHPDVARSLATLARLDHLTGRFADAERGFRAALALQRAALGDSAAATRTTMYEFAGALHSSGRYAPADTVFAEWERLAAAYPGRRDAQYADQLEALGQFVVARARGDSVALRRAERHFREALAIRRALFGPRHPLVAFGEERVALAAWTRGERAEGEALFRSALATLRAVYPEGHPDLAILLSEFGNRLAESGRREEGLAMLRETLVIARRYLGEENILTAAYVAGYGDALRKAGEHADAVPVLRDAVARFERRAGEHGLMTVRARINLATSLGELGRIGEAEPLLLAAHAQLEKERGVRNPQTQFALRAIVQLYDGAGRPRDAARYRALLTAAGAGDARRSTTVH